jgi:hypothetical protein
MKDRFSCAVGSDSDVYHLFDLGSWRTLCGLPVSQATASLGPSRDLRFIEHQPQTARLCRHCDDAIDARALLV